MRFRPPLRNKWFYPFVLCGLLLFGYCTVTTIPIAQCLFGRSDSDMLLDIAWVILFVAFACWVCVMVSWTIWTSQIDVDDRGVRWRSGKEEGSMSWEEIGSLVLDGTTIGLVEKASAKIRPLPFVSRPLYKELSRRLNPLKPGEEEILFPAPRIDRR